MTRRPVKKVLYTTPSPVLSDPSSPIIGRLRCYIISIRLFDRVLSKSNSKMKIHVCDNSLCLYSVGLHFVERHLSDPVKQLQPK